MVHTTQVSTWKADSVMVSTVMHDYSKLNLLSSASAILVILTQTKCILGDVQP